MNSREMEALNELKEYNKKLIPAVEKTAISFRKQREDQALKLLGPVAEGLQWSFEVVSLTKETLASFGINIDNEEINATLRELMGAMDNQDFVLLADVLEYEILEMLKSWQLGLQKELGS